MNNLKTQAINANPVTPIYSVLVDVSAAPELALAPVDIVELDRTVPEGLFPAEEIVPEGEVDVFVQLVNGQE